MDAPDALLVFSFGGPEGLEDVIPFLEHVLEGRNVPRSRLEEVGAHYGLFGGVSPINEQNRELVAALRDRLDLPIYWGNRHWTPFVAETIQQMADDGVRHALCFVTSAYAGVSSCRVYLDELADARAAVGPGAPTFDKLPVFHDHPLFVEPTAAALTVALDGLGAAAHVLYTAHSVPISQAEVSDYEVQLRDTMALVHERAGGGRPHALVFQSRSGPPTQPWLAPDVNDHLRAVAAGGATEVVLCPIGFVSDHMEVVYDLDVQAAATAANLGIGLRRVPTVGVDLADVVVALVDEHQGRVPRRSLSRRGPYHETCDARCCRAL